MPVNLSATTITQLGIGGCYYVEAPENAPEWGIRMTLTRLYPKK